MVTLNGMDYTFNTASFSISSAADIAKLPTMTAEGREGNTVFPPVKAGSTAITTSGDFKLYMLDGESNSWEERS